MDELITKVEKWSIDKGLDKADSKAQFLKCCEELGEIAAALVRGNTDLEEGIGDVVVTLIILAQQNGMTLESCLETAYDEIKDRTGKMVGSTFVKSEDLT